MADMNVADAHKVINHMIERAQAEQWGEVKPQAEGEVVADANEDQIEVATEESVVDTEMSDEAEGPRGMAPRMVSTHPQYAAFKATVKTMEGSDSNASGMILEYMGDEVFMPVRQESHCEFVQLQGLHPGLQAFVWLEWDQQKFVESDVFDFLGSWNERSESGMFRGKVIDTRNQALQEAFALTDVGQTKDLSPRR